MKKPFILILTSIILASCSITINCNCKKEQQQPIYFSPDTPTIKLTPMDSTWQENGVRIQNF